MAVKNRVTGMETVLHNLNEEIAKIKGATMAGLFEAGLKIQGQSQRRTPVDNGNLKGSAYTRSATRRYERLEKAPDPEEAPPPTGAVKPHTVEIGYTANYAIYVHENLEARHTVGQAKFLESALRDNEAKIVDIVQQKASVE